MASALQKYLRPEYSHSVHGGVSSLLVVVSSPAHQHPTRVHSSARSIFRDHPQHYRQKLIRPLQATLAMQGNGAVPGGRGGGVCWAPSMARESGLSQGCCYLPPRLCSSTGPYKMLRPGQGQATSPRLLKPLIRQGLCSQPFPPDLAPPAPTIRCPLGSKIVWEGQVQTCCRRIPVPPPPGYR